VKGHRGTNCMCEAAPMETEVSDDCTVTTPPRESEPQRHPAQMSRVHLLHALRTRPQPLGDPGNSGTGPRPLACFFGMGLNPPPQQLPPFEGHPDHRSLGAMLTHHACAACCSMSAHRGNPAIMLLCI